MLAHFPTPYPDEDFRSIVYRYHIRTGYSDLQLTNIELFNTKSHKNTAFPRNWIELCYKLPSTNHMLVERILHNHTLWPLVRPFLTDSQIEQYIQEIYFGVNSKQRFSSRMLTKKHNRILTSIIRYCPKCLIEDYNLYGETYVHRFHQINFLDLCHIHKVRLVTCCPVCNEKLTREYGTKLLVSPYCPNGHLILDITLPLQPNEIDIKQQIIKDCQIIIEASLHTNRSEIIRRFQITLGINGYMFLSGKIKKQKFAEEFSDFLHNLKLEQLDIPYFFINTRSVRVWMFREDKNSQNILFYIFAMRFLFGSVEEFLYGQMSFSTPLPFGIGPWGCLNQNCIDYGKLTIKNCNRLTNHSGSHIAGSFCCPTCGYTYNKRWTLATEGIEQRPKIIKMGWLWESKFITLYKKGLSCQEIARELKSQTNVVKRALSRLQLHNEQLESRQGKAKEMFSEFKETATTSDTFISRLEKCRKKILNIVEGGENLTRVQINRAAPGAYKWLMKYDREWMEKFLPQRQASSMRLDWESIDRELVLKVQDITNRLYMINPSVRIRKHVIINSLPGLEKGRLMNGPDKLPLSWNVLLQYEETKEDFLIRNVPNIVRQLLRDGYKNVTLNSIMAFRRSYRGCSEHVRNGIVEVLKEMGFKDVETGFDRYMNE